MTLTFNLPHHPKVVTQNKKVIIVFENGNELVWCEEKTKKQAIKLAKEVELELRAVQYVKTQVHDFIFEMKKHLSSLDIDEILLDSILIDGHAFAREQLNQVTVETITMGAEHGVRKEVMNNLSSELFII